MAVSVRNPHFDLPFRFGSSVAVVSQDTYADIANSVEAIVRTPYAYRFDAPEFGLEEQVFTNQPLEVEELKLLIEEQEPRAEVLIEQNPDFFDELVVRMVIDVGVPEARFEG